MDIVRKRGVVGGQGNAAGDYSDFVQRSGSWQYGADCHSNAIEDEGQEEDLKFGVPHDTMDFDPIEPTPDLPKTDLHAQATKRQNAMPWERVKAPEGSGRQDTVLYKDKPIGPMRGK